MRRLLCISLVIAAAATSATLRADELPKAAPGPAAHVTLTPQARQLQTSDWDALHLGRAVDRWILGDLRGAVDMLGRVDISATSTFAQADRAAFLLAIASLQLDDVEAFHRVAERAAAETGSPYRRWIRYCQLIESGRGGYTEAGSEGSLLSDLPGAAILGASLLLEIGRAEDALRVLDRAAPERSVASIHFYLAAIVHETLGHDASAQWERLATQKPQRELEADLIATAAIRVATSRIEAGRDASEWLDRVPATSRHAARALHLRGMLAIEAGDTDTGRATLTQLLASFPAYDERREVRLALGALDSERDQWQAALDAFESAEADWNAEYGSLTALEDPNSLPDAWRIWASRVQWREEIRVAPEAVLFHLTESADGSLDLNRDPQLDTAKGLGDAFWPGPDTALPPAWDHNGMLARHRPQPDEWMALRDIQQQQRHANTVLERQERVVRDRERELERHIAYIRQGYDRSAQSTATIEEAVSRLAATLALLDQAVAQLTAARDSTLLAIATRTRDMAVDVRRQLLFMQAVRHFYVDGPQRHRPEKFPTGVPSPGELLALESTLAAETGSFLTLFAEHYPAVIARSYDEIWEPRLTGDTRKLYDELVAELTRSRRITAALDSTLKGYANDPALAAARLRRDELAAATESLRTAEDTMRVQIARAVAVRGRERLRSESEAIEYHLADAAYELAVEVATNPATAEDSTAVAPLRTDAIVRLDTFLAHHPQSLARGESRYRLADMRLLQARDDFQVQMASFLGEAPSADDIENRALAPFVDYQPAVALYQSILAEDTDFPHTDAVLFNLGMILSDDGQASAAEHLERLVREYPDSPDAQEAWLRMGGDHFDREDFAGSVDYFEQAIKGDDASFQAIALYKLGWARFEEDEFHESADAFRRLMDLYQQHSDVAKAMDLRDEAEEYLVHSLARSGGASAFADYFDALGGRDYEPRVLMSLAHLVRGLSLYSEAVECDELWLARYPEHPEALAVAERLVNTYKRWNKPDAARSAKLALAERFLPGSPWLNEIEDEEVRASGVDFARSAYRENAAHHHRQARASNKPASWQQALSNYQTYLTYWPDASDAPRMHFHAGEAAGRLNQYPQSLSHFAAAAASDTASFAVDAAFQQVAITDSWYRSVGPAGEGRETVPLSDSLAVNLLKVGSDFARRYPADKRSVDVMWRHGNVAYAHGWYVEAATTLALMSDRYPTDTRAPRAIRMSGDAHYRREDFASAGAAYEKALVLARTAGADSLIAEYSAKIPLCYYQHAEGVAAADTKNGDKKASPLFARVARQWPDFKHADIALYRSGLGFAAGERYADAAAAWETLLADHPGSEYARDSAIQFAQAHEKSGNTHSAARAYERFSRMYTEDPDASAALIRAADLLAEAKDPDGAEEMRSLFLERFPGDTETVMEIRSTRTTALLAGVTAGTSTLSSLLASSKAGASADGSTQSDSELQAYLKLAAAHPEHASPEILAHVDFLKAEDEYARYQNMRLTQPLPPSIERKQTVLQDLLKQYEGCAGRDVREYARASANRIGQILFEFGDALIDSERPPELNDDDLLAYDDVLADQAWEFYERGVEVWSQLLRQVGDPKEDPGQWVARTREALWPRLAQRFVYQPEVDYPLIAGTPPAQTGSN